MMKFRYHRGSLKDSLATTEDFSINKIMTTSIYNDSNAMEPIKRQFELIISYYAYDDRCNQDLWSLSLRDKTGTQSIIGFMWEG